MTWVDGVVLAVLALSAVIAYFRGMVREVLSLGAWAGAVVAALALRREVGALLASAIEPPWVAEALAAAGLFLVVLIVLKLVAAAIADRVPAGVLGELDRALGLVFGLARGAFIVILAYILGGMLVSAGEPWPQPVRDARVLPVVADAARWLSEQMPPDIQPRLPAQPVSPGPTQDDLMRPPARNRT